MKTKNIKQKIKEFFLENPTKKLRVRQIERGVGVPLPSAIRYAKELVSERILRQENISDIKLFSANSESPEYLLEKRLYNLRALHLSGLIEYLIQEYSNPVIILFGSYSKGEDIETSDIDLYVETPSKKIIDLKKIESKLSRKIQLFIHKNIKNISNPHLANNILNGIVLSGSIEVF